MPTKTPAEHVGLLPHERALQTLGLCQMREAEDLRLTAASCTISKSQLASGALRLIPNAEMVQAPFPVPLPLPPNKTKYTVKVKVDLDLEKQGQQARMGILSSETSIRVSRLARGVCQDSGLALGFLFRGFYRGAPLGHGGPRATICATRRPTEGRPASGGLA